MGGKDACQRSQPSWFLGKARIDLLNGRFEPRKSYLQKHFKLLLCGGVRFIEAVVDCRRVLVAWRGLEASGGERVAGSASGDPQRKLLDSCMENIETKPQKRCLPASITWYGNSSTFC